MVMFLVYPTKVHWMIVLPLAFFISLPFITFTIASRIRAEEAKVNIRRVLQVKIGMIQRR